MAMTPKGRVQRQGVISFGDASLHIWEEGIKEARDAGGWAGAQAWERQFKRQVFARIVQTLNRLGWTVGPQTYIFTTNDARHCRKGDLQADLRISGRTIEFQMFQAVNCPTRPDHEGRYESNKEAAAPYLLRLEMVRTRRRIADYLCAVFSDYTLKPAKIKSHAPDPLAYFNDSWDSEHEKATGRHRFERGPDGWPSVKALSSWDRKDRDGIELYHGDVRWYRDSKGRLLRGRVYGGINGMWSFIYGPGDSDRACDNACMFFTYRRGETPAKVVNPNLRRRRLEELLRKAVEATEFLRAQQLKEILFPVGPQYAIQVKRDGLFFGPMYRGYRRELKNAGLYSFDELKPYLHGGLETDELRAIEVTA